MMAFWTGFAVGIVMFPGCFAFWSLGAYAWYRAEIWRIMRNLLRGKQGRTLSTRLYELADPVAWEIAKQHKRHGGATDGEEKSGILEEEVR